MAQHSTLKANLTPYVKGAAGILDIAGNLTDYTIYSDTDDKVSLAIEKVWAQIGDNFESSIVSFGKEHNSVLATKE